MSLYNMLFGKNPHTDIILALIGLKECDVERFRDCGISLEDKKIWVYTRTGGGNRGDYPNEKLTSNPLYVTDYDDDYDCTYATYEFKFPKEIEEDILNFLDMRNKGISAKLINWLDKTFQREETEEDKWCNTIKRQTLVVESLQRKYHVSEAFNGHTLIPFSDYGMEQILKVSEENDGEFIAYWACLPYKFKLLQNESRWSCDKSKSELEQDQVRLRPEIVWEIDIDAWNRYKAKFEEKYPKSIAVMKKRIENIVENGTGNTEGTTFVTQ